MTKMSSTIIPQVWKAVALGELEIALRELPKRWIPIHDHVVMKSELERLATIVRRWKPSVRVITEELPALARELSTALAQSDINPFARVAAKHIPKNLYSLIQLAFAASREPRLIEGCLSELGHPGVGVDTTPAVESELEPLIQADLFICPDRGGRQVNRYTIYKERVGYGVTLIRGLREVLGLYSRLEQECDHEQQASALADFRARLVREVELPEDLARKLSVIGSVVFSDFRCPLADAAMFPKVGHGPGAVAERWCKREKPWLKNYVHAMYDPDIHDIVDPRIFRYPFQDDDSSWRLDFRDFKFANLFAPCVYATQRCVPKDYRGPRIIAKMPLLHTYCSKAISAAMRKYLSSSCLKGAINFAAQSINQRCAVTGSRTGEYATIDCKDASDHVRLVHWRALFKRTPEILRWYEAVRAKGILLENGELVEPYTTASAMGDYSCFDLETCVILSILIAALWDGEMGPTVNMNRGTIAQCIRRCGLHVYGDDVVVRSDLAPCAISALTEAGLVINNTKCCISGRFRESCGVDALLGIDITPLRPRHLPGALRESFGGARDNIQNFADRGNIVAAEWFYHYVQRRWHQTIPIVPNTVSRDHGPYIYCTWFCDDPEAVPAKLRWNGEYQRNECRVPIARPKSYDHQEFWLDRYRGHLTKGHDDHQPRTWVGEDLPQDKWQGYPSSREVIRHCWCKVSPIGGSPQVLPYRA